MKGNGAKYLLSALSGILLIFTFAPFNLYVLAWVALVPFLLSIEGLSTAPAFKAGFLMGLCYFFGTTYWIYHAMHDYGGMALAPSLLIVAALAAYLSLYTAVFAVIYSNRIRHSRLPALLLAPVFWVMLEYIRSYLFTGFPWSTLGYSQWKFPAVIQIADITGVYGISFLVVSVNAAVADFFILRRRVRLMPLYPVSYAATGWVLLSGLLAFTFLYGAYRLNESRPGRPLTASIVQGDINQSMKWDQRYQNRVLGIYEKLTAEADPSTPPGALSGQPVPGAFNPPALNPSAPANPAKTGLNRPGLIVWPESALPFPFDGQDPRVDGLDHMQQTLGVPLLIGALRQMADGQYANSAILIDRGRPAYIYDKIHLVPFGEYVPLKRVLFFVNGFSDAIGDLAPGRYYTDGGIGQEKFATAICYEMAFPGLVRKFFRNGGDFLVTITDDTWFGRSTGPYQNFSMCALRAVENRKPVIRAANSGVSGFFTSTGRVIKKSPLFKRQILTATIMTDPTVTFYTRFGDLFSYLCILTALFVLIFSDEKETF